jgi:hypothetical protein
MFLSLQISACCMYHHQIKIVWHSAYIKKQSVGGFLVNSKWAILMIFQNLLKHHQ